MNSKFMPRMTETSKPFWQGLKEGELRIQQCNQCGGWVFFSRSHCSHGLSHDLEWKPVSGKGTLYIYTFTRSPMQVDFASDTPQVLAVVELVQGVRLNTTLVGLEEKEIKVGMAVKPVLNQVDAKGNTLLHFTAAEEQLGPVTLR